MRTYYIIIHPKTGKVDSYHNLLRDANKRARDLSREFQCGVEIKRFPKPYDFTKLILVM